MKCKNILTLGLLPAALLCAGVAFAQTVPATSQSTGSGSTYNSTTTSSTTQSSRNQSMSSGEHEKFGTLAGSKGYINRSDAAQDTWLSQHFQKCDKNDNSQISRSEYKSCRRSQRKAASTGG